MKRGILDWIWGVITSPMPTLREICGEKPVGWAIVVVLVAFFLSGIASFLLGPAPAEMPISPGTMVILITLMALPIAFIWAGLVQGAAWILKGRGAYFGIFSGLCFADVPYLFSPIIALLTFLGTIGNILFSIFFFGLWIWSIVLAIMAIRGNYGFTTGRAIATFFLAFVSIFIICFITGFIIGFVHAIIIGIAGA